jgi:hypothetical protein
VRYVYAAILQRKGAANVTAHPAQLLTVEEAAALLRRAPSTLREHARRGLVPCTRFPYARRVLFDPDTLAAWRKDPQELEKVELWGGGWIVQPKRKGKR